VVWQGLRAWQVRPPDGASPSARYYEHAGFTLVALVDAFLVVTVLHTGAPVWAVAATGVVVALAGHFALRIGRRWIVTDVTSPRRRPMRQRSVRRRMCLPARLAHLIAHFDDRRPHPVDRTAAGPTDVVVSGSSCGTSGRPRSQIWRQRPPLCAAEIRSRSVEAA